MKREDSSMNNDMSMNNSNASENMNMAAMSIQTKKKSGNARRFLLLVILLICTVALLGGATYAWFTANTKVMVQEMQIQVTVAKGIQISADANNWQAAMTLPDIYKAGGMSLTGTLASGNQTEDAGSINHIPGLLYNISSLGNIRDKDYQIGGAAAADQASKLDLYTGKAALMCWIWDDDKKENGAFKEVGSDGSGSDLSKCDWEYNPSFTPKDGLVESQAYKEATTSCAGADDYYEIDGLEAGDSGRGQAFCDANDQVIAFDMYLKLDQTSRISLAENSYVRSSTKDDYGLQNTIRVAFVTLGTQPSKFYNGDNEDEAETTGILKEPAADKPLTAVEQDYKDAFGGYVGKYGARIMNIFGNITIWEPNNIQHTKAAIEHAKKNYNLTVNRSSDATTKAIYAPITGNKKEFDVYYHDSATDKKSATPKKVNNAAILPLYMTDTNEKEYPAFFAEQKTVTDVAAANSAFKTATSSSNEPYKNEVLIKKTPLETAERTPIFVAPAGVTKLRVYIWVEGSDIDTENNATSSTLDVGLFFTSAEAGGDAPIDEANDFIDYSANAEKYGSASGKDNKVWRDSTPTTVTKPYTYTPAT